MPLSRPPSLDPFKGIACYPDAMHIIRGEPLLSSRYDTLPVMVRARMIACVDRHHGDLENRVRLALDLTCNLWQSVMEMTE